MRIEKCDVCSKTGEKDITGKRNIYGVLITNHDVIVKVCWNCLEELDVGRLHDWLGVKAIEKRDEG